MRQICLERPQSTLSILKSEHGKALKCYERALLYAYKVPQRDDHLYDFPQSTVAYKEAIAELYTQTIVILAGRYFYQRTDLIAFYSKVKGLPRSPDRDVRVAGETVSRLIVRFSKLQDDVKSISIGGDGLINLKQSWLGLDNISRLLMDEISHLNGRVDQVLSRIASHESAADAEQAITYALWTLTITAGITLLAIFVTILVAGI